MTCQTGVRFLGNQVDQAATSSVGGIGTLKLQSHAAIYRSDSFVLMLCDCANLKA